VRTSAVDSGRPTNRSGGGGHSPVAHPGAVARAPLAELIAALERLSRSLEVHLNGKETIADLVNVP
jgi:hypothetical protein